MSNFIDLFFVFFKIFVQVYLNDIIVINMAVTDDQTVLR